MRPPIRRHRAPPPKRMEIVKVCFALLHFLHFARFHPCPATSQAGYQIQTGKFQSFTLSVQHPPFS